MPVIRFVAQDLLYNHLHDDRFWNNISITNDEVKFLAYCREKVRNKIRSAFAEIRSDEDYSRANLFLEQLDSSERSILKNVVPKFRPQGSSVYKTLNDPPFSPPQQIDVDDGVYLPMRVIEGNPALGKRIFFDIVDEALRDLVKEEGWKEFVPKNTCARVIVNKKIHVDVPLYAVPNEAFSALSKNRGNESSETKDVLLAFSEEVELDTNEIYLAVRDRDHWKKSDPGKIEMWFVNQVGHHGERYRRVCRYVKAWRDFAWPKGDGPSSIALMICVWKSFAKNRKFNYDCEALLRVAEDLPSYLADKIYNPADESSDPEEMYPRDIDRDKQQQYQEYAQHFANALRDSLCNSRNADDVIRHLITALGDRIPKSPALISLADVAKQLSQQQKKKQPKSDIPHNLISG